MKISEILGESTPYRMQQFIGRGRWSADELRDVLQEYVKEKIEDETAVLVVDETGFLKQGKMSAGVQRQYSGTAGRIENCQIGVFMNYAVNDKFCCIDRELYVPMKTEYHFNGWQETVYTEQTAEYRNTLKKKIRNICLQL